MTKLIFSTEQFAKMFNNTKSSICIAGLLYYFKKNFFSFYSATAEQMTTKLTVSKLLHEFCARIIKHLKTTQI